MKENNIFMNLVNMIITIGFITCLSFGAYYFCNWYGCNSFRSFLYLDMVCNMCIDISYHFKNYQYTLYGGTMSLLSYKLHSLINWVQSPNEKYIFEDYVLGKNSPRRLNIKKKNIN